MQYVKENINVHTELMKEEIKSGYQKILDEAITSCTYLIQPYNAPITSGDVLLISFDDETNNLIVNNGIDVGDDGYVNLKGGHKYIIFPHIMMTGNDHAGTGYHIVNREGIDIEAGIVAGQVNTVIRYSTAKSSYGDNLVPAIYMPKEDTGIAIRITQYDNGNLFSYGIMAFELKQPVYTNVYVASYADQVGHGEDTPVGQIISFMGTKAPENYLACDGAEYNIGDYLDLEDFSSISLAL